MIDTQHAHTHLNILCGLVAIISSVFSTYIIIISILVIYHTGVVSGSLLVKGLI